MNLQHIADFLDMVSNPEKYQAVLQRLQEEQARLNAAIETVGKASELDKLRKDVEKKAEQFEQDFIKRISSAEKRLESKFELAAEAQKSADLVKETADKLYAEAQVVKSNAESLAQSFEGRDKSLRQAEDLVVRRQAKLDNLVQEYNAKIEKLRSVMA
jgi:chromosome segregation ATPase